jgi:hypothetical protein
MAIRILDAIAAGLLIAWVVSVSARGGRRRR